MAMMALIPGFSLAALARMPADMPLPQAASALGKQSHAPDVVVFSSAPMRVLSDLASAGLRELAALLPMIEQAVENASAAPLGHLAKAAGAAARQIVDGHEALLAEGPDRVGASLKSQVMTQSSPPATGSVEAKQVLRTLARQIGAEVAPAEPGRASESLRAVARQLGAADLLKPRPSSAPDAGPIERWLSEAKHLLHSTGEALGRAKEQLRPPMPEPANLAGASPTGWVLTEILAAQAQIATSYKAVSRARTAAHMAYRAEPRARSSDHLAAATTLFGILLTVSTLWLLGGIWLVATGIGALASATVWVWRINRASRGVTLDARS